jgi:hypothetical protein
MFAAKSAGMGPTGAAGAPLAFGGTGLGAIGAIVGMAAT